MFKTLFLTITLLLGSTAAQAQTTAADHEAHHASAEPVGASNELPWVQAEIRRIDTSARKVTLRHGDIPNLEMPAMTMVFQVADVQWLSAFKVGERVRFSVTQVKGAYIVQRMERIE